MKVGARLRELAERVGLMRRSSARTRLMKMLGSQTASVAERTIGVGEEQVKVWESGYLPAPAQTVELPGDEQLRALDEKAAGVNGFLLAFTGRDPGPQWTLEDLDAAFTAWLTAENRKYYSKQTVIAITGAAFGTYLVKHLGMRWLWLTDGDGSAWAVRDANDTVTSFPHHTVAKRIDDSESGFFLSVFRYLRSEVRASPNKSLERTRER